MARRQRPLATMGQAAGLSVAALSRVLKILDKLEKAKAIDRVLKILTKVEKMVDKLDRLTKLVGDLEVLAGVLDGGKKKAKKTGKKAAKKAAKVKR